MDQQYSVQLDRHEAKYIISPRLVPQIREFIRPFCLPDEHTRGDPPEYDVTTLQLDTPSLSLYHAKELEVVNRFKLRARTYGNNLSDPVFLEIKKKFRGCIQKSRACIPREMWQDDIIKKTRLPPLTFWSEKEEMAYLEFIRLVKLLWAEPVALIRYTREAYFGKMDHYARVTFDRALMYQPTRAWDLSGDGKRWLSIDTSLAQNKSYPYSGVVLELKTLSDAPQWMIDLVMEFGLVRTGNCKYATAVGLESLFRGSPPAPQYAMDMLTY
ncbi:MAG: polyphosphate polymerase domain-containing protein [Kiritimatiellae bacterium]|nr:polyphosphate polymerase domain-containing protein [Kiritimatiellia bacterium]MDD5520135.1 polyphosphate polymerase domain-containing protein [Kiritimatiellia bacterium]